jgi:hypothetical protein
MASDICSWRIEVGPVFPGAGPGDGSDASFETVAFSGTAKEADARGKTLCLEVSGRFESSGIEAYPYTHPDLGVFYLGYSKVEDELL